MFKHILPVIVYQCLSPDLLQNVPQQKHSELFVTSHFLSSPPVRSDWAPGLILSSLATKEVFRVGAEMGNKVGLAIRDSNDFF